MRRKLLIVLIVAAVVAAVFGVVTLFALEGRTVAILHTKTLNGEDRRTHVWIAEDDDSLWIESATESRPFYLDIQLHPIVTLEIRERPFDPPSRVERGRAEVVADPGGHRHIRKLLAARYGWADKWIGLLTDTSASRAIRITIPKKTWP